MRRLAALDRYAGSLQGSGLNSTQLSALWGYAQDALAGADRIVFLGYRFPESDAQAKSRLLAAIGSNEKPLDVHIVLGPQTARDDATRLQGMLHHASWQRRARGVAMKVEIERMWGQDFLTVFKPRSW